MADANLAIGETYHVFSRSIANFRIFNTNFELDRMRQVISYYKNGITKVKFSQYAILQQRIGMENSCLNMDKSIKIIAYCLMNTHVHLILQQLKKNGISVFMNNILNSYTRYFNIKHRRKGPLWETRFKRVLVETDDQLLYLTRYLHLNPVSAYLVDSPDQWPFSSYKEYLSRVQEKDRICEFSHILNINPETYQKFTTEHIDEQRRLAYIKNLIFDHDSTA